MEIFVYEQPYLTHRKRIILALLVRRDSNGHQIGWTIRGGLFGAYKWSDTEWVVGPGRDTSDNVDQDRIFDTPEAAWAYLQLVSD